YTLISYCAAAPRALHAFPTRRSSDLLTARRKGPNRPRACARSRQFWRNIRPGLRTLARLVAKWLCQKSVSFSRSGCPPWSMAYRSEEHTSELQSRFDLVCRLLLEKKK